MFCVRLESGAEPVFVVSPAGLFTRSVALLHSDNKIIIAKFKSLSNIFSARRPVRRICRTPPARQRSLRSRRGCAWRGRRPHSGARQRPTLLPLPGTSLNKKKVYNIDIIIDIYIICITLHQASVALIYPTTITRATNAAVRAPSRGAAPPLENNVILSLYRQ